MSHWTCTSVFSWVLSPGRHPSSWHAISWYFHARRSADKNCTMWQIICRRGRRTMHLEQLASRHSWPDTIPRNICNTAVNLLVWLMAAATVFLNWRLRNVQYDMRGSKPPTDGQQYSHTASALTICYSNEQNQSTSAAKSHIPLKHRTSFTPTDFSHCIPESQLTN